VNTKIVRNAVILAVLISGLIFLAIGFGIAGGFERDDAMRTQAVDDVYLDHGECVRVCLPDGECAVVCAEDAPTPTPVPPTDTPEPTSTFTPVPPTETVMPLPTDTSTPTAVTPTDTPEPTVTPTPAPQANVISLSAQAFNVYEGQLTGLGPFVAYAVVNEQNYEQRLRGIENAQSPEIIGKVLAFGSRAFMESKIADAQRWHNAGVTTLSYNTENSITPVDEMNDLYNSVGLFATKADAYGFRSTWGPIRVKLDNVPDTVAQAMIASGLDGIGLQEQKPIENQCVEDRIAAVEATVSWWQGLAGPDFGAVAQVVPNRCLNGDTYGEQSCSEDIQNPYDHCVMFVHGIWPVIDAVSIFSNGPDLVDLIIALRGWEGAVTGVPFGPFHLSESEYSQ